MFYRDNAYDLSIFHHGELLREASDDRVIKMARKARYTRSGSGYRFIAAGETLFHRHDEARRAA
jgi:hypothetical protein